MTIIQMFLPVNKDGKSCPARTDVSQAKADARKMYLRDNGISRLPPEYMFAWKSANGCWHGIIHDKTTLEDIRTGIRILTIPVNISDVMPETPPNLGEIPVRLPIQRSVANR